MRQEGVDSVPMWHNGAQMKYSCETFIRKMQNHQQEKRYHFLRCPVVRHEFVHVPGERIISFFKVEE
jgi:hypothetical protein